jgi:hypothetical protein
MLCLMTKLPFSSRVWTGWNAIRRIERFRRFNHHGGGSQKRVQIHHGVGVGADPPQCVPLPLPHRDMAILCSASSSSPPRRSSSGAAASLLASSSPSDGKAGKLLQWPSLSLSSSLYPSRTSLVRARRALAHPQP